MGFATVFVSKPVEDKLEIKDKEMEVILVVEDSREDKKKPGLELEEKNETPDLNLNIEESASSDGNVLDRI